MPRILVVLAALLLTLPAAAQTARAIRAPKNAHSKPTVAAQPAGHTTEPLTARFYLQDITNFWRAYDAWAAGATGNPFDSLYWRPATAQTRLLLTKNGIANPDSLRTIVRRRRLDYARCRPTTERIAEALPQCRAAYLALKNLYPAATFPAAHFGIGTFGVGGNYEKNAGLVIGAEMHELATIRTLVAHELAHAQQQIPYKYRIILEQCLIEGGADFVCEMISGYVATPTPHAWAKGREKEIWLEFERDQNLGKTDNWARWLYGGERPAGRPADVGYYIGYEICRAYYARAPDKRQAIYDILHIRDARDFLRHSHYADRFR
ncbi:MAG: hypothetical protein H7330_06450 [Hymenobacteraceae bacterium]|nr:hypothetical protein [Hymenobacteraceae bacterium]